MGSIWLTLSEIYECCNFFLPTSNFFVAILVFVVLRSYNGSKVAFPFRCCVNFVPKESLSFFGQFLCLHNQPAFCSINQVANFPSFLAQLFVPAIQR